MDEKLPFLGHFLYVATREKEEEEEEQGNTSRYGLDWCDVSDRITGNRLYVYSRIIALR